MNIYENMIECLKTLKERESIYKESVDNANAFLHGEFKTTIDKLTSMLIPPPAAIAILQSQEADRKHLENAPDSLPGIESARCQAVHEAINKFVVYEKFAEMTHKYDVQNFSKLLDDYNTADELKAIRAYLDIEQQQVAEEGSTGLAEEAKVASPSPKQATSYRFHFVQYQATGGRSDLTQVPREELTPPKDKLSAYAAAHYPELLRYILLTRIIH